MGVDLVQQSYAVPAASLGGSAMPTLFVDALTDAIERWSADVARRQPSAFLHRGADLRHAVERVLYFVLVNDEAVRAAHATFLAAGAVPPTLPDHVYFRLVGPYLFSPASDRRGDRLSGSEGARWSTRLVRALGLLRYIAASQRSAADLDAPPDVLFIVTHPKFVEFLRPIAAMIGKPAAFVTIDDPHTESHLSQLGLPRYVLRQQPWPVAEGALRNFGSLCASFDSFHSLLRRIRPQVVVIPEGNAPLHEVVRVAAAKLNVRSLCLQYGWSPISHPGFRHLSYDNMLVWGPMFAEMLARHNPRQLFTVTGNPGLSGAQPIAVRDGPVKGIGFFLQKGGPLIGVNEWPAFLDLIGWTAKHFPDLSVIVREHPSTQPLDADERARIGHESNIRFMAPAEHSLAQTLALCDVVVSAYSTTLLEALAFGAIPLIVAPVGMSRYWPDLVAMGAAIEGTGAEDARSSLAALVADADLRGRLRSAGRSLRSQLFAAIGRDAAANISAQVAAAVDSKRCV